MALVVENSPANVEDIRDVGSIPELGGSPWGRHGNLLQYSCLGNPHGQRSLGATCSWGHKESDTTEWLSTAQRVLETNTLPHGLMLPLVCLAIYLFSELTDLTLWCLLPLNAQPLMSLSHSLSYFYLVASPHLLLLYWLCQRLWLCGSQQTMENS